MQFQPTLHIMIREAIDRAMIMQLNLLPVARKMVLEELEMEQNG